MSTQPEQLRDRTKAFALRVIRLYRSLPYRTDAQAVLWLELMTESGVVPLAKAAALLKEANELTAIFAASQRTARHIA
ncbi:MAG TPA: hypothetical protein VEJ00_05830 [Candidatus Acidoferrales bacterium]|nr:hypothetical protein [Candidatus Acidoferrales bacterium]